MFYIGCLKLFSDNLIDINGEEINYSKEAKNLLDENQRNTRISLLENFRLYQKNSLFLSIAVFG